MKKSVCLILITPDIGHWFPKNLDVKIDNAIRFILESEDLNLP